MYRFIKKYHYQLVIVLTLMSLVAIALVDTHLKTPITPHGILDFEWAKTPLKTNQILHAWGTQGSLFAAFSLGIDYLFLVFYTLFFVLTTQRLSNNNHFIIKKTTNAVILLFLLAGFYDALENYFLLRILIGQNTSNMALQAYMVSLSKFLLIGLGVLYLTVSAIIKFVEHKKQ